MTSPNQIAQSGTVCCSLAPMSVWIPQSDDSPALASGQVSGSRRRDKPQLSCFYCRRRKCARPVSCYFPVCAPWDMQPANCCEWSRIRCDRQQPCANCSSRALTCRYASDGAMAPPIDAATENIRDRVAHLEQLVMSLFPSSSKQVSHLSQVDSAFISSRGASSRCTLSDYQQPNDSTESGSLRLSASEPRYVGVDHWATILDSIATLKEHFHNQDDEANDAQESSQFDSNAESAQKTSPPHALLLYGCLQPASRYTLIAALPPKSTADRYVSCYFNRLYLAYCWF